REELIEMRKRADQIALLRKREAISDRVSVLLAVLIGVGPGIREGRIASAFGKCRHRTGQKHERAGQCCDQTAHSGSLSGVTRASRPPPDWRAFRSSRS